MGPTIDHSPNPPPPSFLLSLSSTLFHSLNPMNCHHTQFTVIQVFLTNRFEVHFSLLISLGPYITTSLPKKKKFPSNGGLLGSHPLKPYGGSSIRLSNVTLYPWFCIGSSSVKVVYGGQTFRCSDTGNMVDGPYHVLANYIMAR